MPMDEYDMTVSKYDEVINIYQNDNLEKIILDFMNKVVASTNKTIEDENLKENIKNTVNILRNALLVLESRIITNIGGKVAHYITPEKYDPELGFKPKWYLIQVWRGYKK
jgi:hypothetical protein